MTIIFTFIFLVLGGTAWLIGMLTDSKLIYKTCLWIVILSFGYIGIFLVFVTIISLINLNY